MNYLVAFYFCLIVINAEKYSSLQILNYGINLIPLQPGNYSLTLDVPISSDQIPEIIYCWKKMKSVTLKGQQNCDLIEDQLIYRCLDINYKRIPRGQKLDNNGSMIYYPESWETTWMEVQLSNNGEFKQIGNSSTHIEVFSPQSLLRKMNFYNEYFQNFTIYHMLTGLSKQNIQAFLSDDVDVKLSYLHTFVHGSYTNTLITQRNLYCILYSNKIVYVFQGAVTRGGELHYFTGILTTTNNNSPFHMWGGYSYSSGHAARDMFGYQSTTENFYDLYSLYAAAPFEDVASNVGGKKNVVRICNSGQSTISSYPFHFIQFYRLFDTLDSSGDEIIQQKIYNKFCFAAYFQNYSTEISQYKLSVLSNGYKHELIDCHIPDLSVFGSLLSFQFEALTFLALIMIFLH